MKTCLCCHTPEAADHRETCSRCGEGSWSECVKAKADPRPAPKSDKAKK